MCSTAFNPKPLLLSLGILSGRRMLPALALAVCAVMAPAQVTTGGFFCTVLDRQDGKPIHNAKVMLESTALFQARTYVTDQNGEIRAVLLPVGNYRVKVSQPGYQSVLMQDLRIGLGANMSRTLDMALLPGMDRAKAQAGSLPEGGAVTIAATRDLDGGVEFSHADGLAPEVRLGALTSSRADQNLEPIRSELRRKLEILASSGLLRGTSSEWTLVLNLSTTGAVTSLKMTGAPAKTLDALNARIHTWNFGPQDASCTLRVPVLLSH